MLGFLSALIFGKNCVSEMCEKELPAEYHGNWKLEQHDANEVRMGRMTQKQFERNMNNGKYRCNTQLPDYDLWIKRIEKYKERFPDFSHNMTKVHLDYVNQQKANKRDLDTGVLRKYLSMDEFL